MFALTHRNLSLDASGCMKMSVYSLTIILKTDQYST
jgi:hypothetical protein